MATRDDLLHVYLRDHLAGATGGLALARRLASTHRGGWAGRDLAIFATDVAQDRETLVEIMAAVGVRHSLVRQALSLLAERVGRLKLNGELLRRSPLSTVMELEMMRMGVEGKASGWRTLRELARSDDRLDGAALGRLVVRAEQQAASLEDIRVRAATEALAT